MRNIDRLLHDYGKDHPSPADRLLHWVCVPVIAWAIVALLWSIPFPWRIGRGIVPLNWAVLGVLAVQVYYFRLSRRLGSGLMLFNLALLWLTASVEARSAVPLWQAGATAFAAGWAGYLLGCRLGNKRVTLALAMQFVLVSPMWLVSLIFARLGFAH